MAGYYDCNRVSAYRTSCRPYGFCLSRKRRRIGVSRRFAVRHGKQEFKNFAAETGNGFKRNRDIEFFTRAFKILFKLICGFLYNRGNSVSGAKGRYGTERQPRKTIVLIGKR